MDKFRGKYRIPSARWATWDYSSNAAYFVTICVANRAHDFGEITDSEMTLSLLGQYALVCWNEIPAHFPFVELGEFVVMPNHVHGIVVINKSVESVESGAMVETQNTVEMQNTVETQNIASLRNRFGPQSQNLASIVRGYKIGVTKFARQNGIQFVWQARYHDHVIRNTGDYERIYQYILDNPQKWEEDEFYALQVNQV
jgi:REP element-mobilizing transposase RayT